MSGSVSTASIRWAALAVLFSLALATTSCGPDTEVDVLAGEAEEHIEGGFAVVHLDSAALALSGVVVGAAEGVESGALRVTGSMTYDQNRVSHIGPRTGGRIVDLAVEVGSRVTEGQVLAHLESAEVGATRVDLHEAEALLAIAQEHYERERRLEQQGISSRRELLDAEAELRRQQARLESARERLRLLGADLHGEGGHFDLVSPYDGVVVEREAGRGEVVGPADQLITVADLSALWIELDVFERSLSLVASGQAVEVTTTAWPGRVFPGRIVYVSQIIDPERRTVRARVEVENGDGALRPGMFATALIGVGNGAVVVTLPRDAVQTVDGADVVFVPGADFGEFVARPVTVGEELPDGRIQIVSGLTLGEPVVLQGAFILKSELAEGEIGDHGH